MRSLTLTLGLIVALALTLSASVLAARPRLRRPLSRSSRVAFSCRG